MVKTTNQIHIYIYDIHYIFKLCNYRYTLCTVYIKKNWVTKTASMQKISLHVVCYIPLHAFAICRAISIDLNMDFH
jgi:hypothetical protein